ncbi:MAG: calcineurin-like phosphoesterase family protein [Albidovulum sp.]|nr:calcineurin-like phosphoesterase family protein [Albidovulum sp.]MDE0529958.1 calcineurin-like phosphoesterase family protein [Albidovulum sp.]
MKTQHIACAVLVASAIGAHAKDATYIGSVEAVPGETALDLAQGTVFVDLNRNSRFDSNETGLPGVMVSNGREVVTTDESGKYQLPAYGDMNLFITKPAGYTTPVSEEMVPQFYYIHKAEGSPDLRFGGIPPTGPLPQQINFPLIADDVGSSFSCLVFGDAQTYTNTEIGYVRETAGRLLADHENPNTECLIFAGDVMGDDLSLYPRFKRVIAVGGIPQYFVGGNHDLDFDADSDQHSFDTFRREWGPEYYSFDIGNVHFVGLDNVRYPCNGIDPHPFCSADKKHTYNGVISQRQLDWLEKDLGYVPEDKLIVLTAHIPFVTFTDNTAAKHQTDNLHELYHIVEGRRVLGLAGHTHTTEQILPGENFEGWAEHTGTGPAQFHQIITGGLSGSWWAGDLNDQGVPRSTQRLGSPRGYYQIDFDGNAYTDTYKTFHADDNTQFHAGFNTPRFRNWAQKLLDHASEHSGKWDDEPAVTINDLGDMNMLTLDDLAGGSWVAVNVWNGSKESQVTVEIDGMSINGVRTQAGGGEAKLKGVEFADPVALAVQSTIGRVAFRSAEGGDDTAGFTTWSGVSWAGTRPGPFQSWMLTDNSSHLWRADLPASLPIGAHVMTVSTTDRYGRSFEEVMTFEVVKSLPNPAWQKEFWRE